MQLVERTAATLAEHECLQVFRLGKRPVSSMRNALLDPRANMVLAVEGGTVLGWATLRGHKLDVFVGEARRRQGIGRALVQRIKAWQPAPRVSRTPKGAAAFWDSVL